MNECCICLEETCEIKLICSHDVCKDCLKTCIQKEMLLCPLCRKYACPDSTEDKTSNSKRVEINIGEYVGITVKGTNYNVFVKNMNKNDCAYKSGLQQGDRLLSINGLNIKHHEQCVGIIDQFTDRHKSFDIEVLAPRARVINITRHMDATINPH